MTVAWGADVNNINVLSCDHLFPGSCVFLPSKSLGSLFDFLLITSADDFHYRFQGRCKKSTHLSPGITMSLAHKLVADHGDVQFFHDEEFVTLSPLGTSPTIVSSACDHSTRNREPQRLGENSVE